jgi:hypothetical protein
MSQLSFFPEDKQNAKSPSGEPHYMIKEEDISSLVMDFVLFCEYVDGIHPYMTSKKEQLNPKACFEINKLLSHREDVPKATYRMDRYVAIYVFYLVAKNTGLIETYSKNASKVELQTTDKYVDFLDFNLYTQFLFLFHGWMQHINTSQLSKFSSARYSTLGPNIDSLFMCLAKSKESKCFILGNSGTPKIIDHFKNFDERRIIQQICLFGIVHYEDEVVNENTSNSYVCISKIQTTALGISLARACATRRFTWINENEKPFFLPFNEEIFRQYVEDVEDDPEHYFAPFLSLFPPGAIACDELADILFPVEPEEEDAEKMVYQFKVSLSGKCYRIIQCLGYNTFEDLHDMIQQAFHFDNDHLYCFYMDGKRYSHNRINGPDDGPPSADNTLLSEADLYVGKKFAYLFDFGDEWFFNITVVHLDEEGSGDEELEILKSVGTAPSQYAF